jgi:hypothetical protein
LETNIEKNNNNTVDQHDALLYVSVITMREIFCRCMEKAKVLDPTGKKLKKPGAHLIAAMVRDGGPGFYPGILRASNRPAYYNDRITTLFKQVESGQLLTLNRYEKSIIAPLVEYAGYKDQLTEINDYFTRCDLSEIPLEKLNSYSPLLLDGKLEFAWQKKESPILPALILATQSTQGQITVLYTPKPFGLLRYPREGKLFLTHDGFYDFISNDGDLRLPLSRITGTSICHMDSGGGSPWVKVTFLLNVTPVVAYFAEFSEPLDTDEFYTLLEPSQMLAALNSPPYALPR